MENETKSPLGESNEIRFDASGKKITAPLRSKEAESAIIAINDKLDQLLGILSSTLPTRIGAELRNISSGGEQLDRLIEIVSNQLPERIKSDASQNTFEKTEMLSVVISTSFQHLHDAFRSYQEASLKALQGLTDAQTRTGELLSGVNALVAELKSTIAARYREPLAEAPQPKPPAEKPSSVPQEPKIEDMPGWLQAKREPPDSSTTLGGVS